MTKVWNRSVAFVPGHVGFTVGSNPCILVAPCDAPTCSHRRPLRQLAIRGPGQFLRCQRSMLISSTCALVASKISISRPSWLVTVLCGRVCVVNFFWKHLVPNRPFQAGYQCRTTIRTASSEDVANSYMSSANPWPKQWDTVVADIQTTILQLFPIFMQTVWGWERNVAARQLWCQIFDWHPV